MNSQTTAPYTRPLATVNWRTAGIARHAPAKIAVNAAARPKWMTRPANAVATPRRGGPAERSARDVLEHLHRIEVQRQSEEDDAVGRVEQGDGDRSDPDRAKNVAHDGFPRLTQRANHAYT